MGSALADVSKNVRGAPEPARLLGALPSQLLQRRKLATKRVSLVVDLEPQTSDALPLVDVVGAQFAIGECLGQGSVAVVYKARSRLDGKEVALKCTRADDDELLNSANEEYCLLRSISHPHIVAAIDFLRCSHGACLVMELFHGTTLTAAVCAAPQSRLSESVARRLFYMLTKALAYLHQRNVAHRDVKGDNILVSNELSDLRLADFNTAKSALSGLLSATGTQLFHPPEVLRGDSLGTSSDVWASGFCLHLMLTGRLPFKKLVCSVGSRFELGEAISACGVQMQGTRWSCVSSACKNCLRRCLEPDPSKRDTAAQMLCSPWLLDEEATIGVVALDATDSVTPR